MNNPYYSQPQASMPMYDSYNQHQAQAQPSNQHGVYQNPPNQVNQPGLEYNLTATMNQPSIQTYQQPVAGLQGWNDPPEKVFMTREDESLVEQTPNHIALISNCIKTVIDRLKDSYLAPSQKRVIIDTEKRMLELYERLNEKKLPKSVLAQLIQLSNALNASDMASATSLSVHLMTSSFDHQGKWVLGVKRLVELYNRYLSGQ